MSWWPCEENHSTPTRLLTVEIRIDRPASLRVHRSTCRCALTNHSHLSTPRDISVKRSAVSRSCSSLASSMAFRADLPNAANADESDSAWLCPSTVVAGYSL